MKLESGDCFAPFHSIISSARASTVGGMSMASALAVLRLITSSIMSWLLDQDIGGLGSPQSLPIMRAH